ncbi:MAG: 4-hydroxythreonine-4-phosphate dehydrogenase PdxA [Phycisphaerales bacterium JB039]
MATLPTIAITCGDPLGIGPEVALGALADPDVARAARWRIYGPRALFGGAASRWPDGAARAQAPVAIVEVAGPLPGGEPRPTAEGGAVSFEAVDRAIADARRSPGDSDRDDGLVTAPISKEAWRLAGHDFPGHTDLLAARFAPGGARAVMSFFSEKLRVALVTTHIPLSQVASAITAARIVEVIEMSAAACERLGIPSPRIAVCGLNPHAGEAGLLGPEDDAIIRPAIEQARTGGRRVSGPHPADTIYRAAVRGEHDLVVAMYHDQGLIPVKLLAFDSAVNVTLGLPTVRTSPDHGTAYDIAGKGVADCGSMKAACLLAARLAAG